MKPFVSEAMLPAVDPAVYPETEVMAGYAIGVLFKGAENELLLNQVSEPLP